MSKFCETCPNLVTGNGGEYYQCCSKKVILFWKTRNGFKTPFYGGVKLRKSKGKPVKCKVCLEDEKRIAE